MGATKLEAARLRGGHEQWQTRQGNMNPGAFDSGKAWGESMNFYILLLLLRSGTGIQLYYDDKNCFQ